MTGFIRSDRAVDCELATDVCSPFGPHKCGHYQPRPVTPSRYAGTPETNPPTPQTSTVKSGVIGRLRLAAIAGLMIELWFYSTLFGRC